MENTKLESIDMRIAKKDEERLEIIKAIVSGKISEEAGQASLERIRAERTNLSIYRNKLV